MGVLVVGAKVGVLVVGELVVGSNVGFKVVGELVVGANVGFKVPDVNLTIFDESDTISCFHAFDGSLL